MANPTTEVWRQLSDELASLQVRLEERLAEDDRDIAPEELLPQWQLIVGYSLKKGDTVTITYVADADEKAWFYARKVPQ